MTHDVIVVGGSYAGMAAALQIARARRKVLVIDAGQRRNRFAAHAQGFLGFDGVPPDQIAATARAQLLRYDSVTWVEGEAVAVTGGPDAFEVTLAGGSRHQGRRLVLATGVRDRLPDIPGLAERWGKSVFHCPYCHGYEIGTGRIGVIAAGPEHLHHMRMLTDWGTVTVLVNGAVPEDAPEVAALTAAGIAVEHAPVRSIEGTADVLLADGRTLSFDGLFVAPTVDPETPLTRDLGLALTEGPTGPSIAVDEMQQTSAAGVFACGDAATPMHSVSIAVGKGAFAGIAAHRSLIFAAD